MSGRGERGRRDAMQRLSSGRVSLQRGPPTRTRRRAATTTTMPTAAAATTRRRRPRRRRLAARPPGGATAPDALSIRFEPSGSVEDDEGSEREERRLPIDETVKLRRRRAVELAREMDGAHGVDFVDVVGEGALCYELSPSSKLPTTAGAPKLVLVYQYGGGFAAEAAEALLCMAIFTRQPDGRPVPLASIYDGKNARRLAEFVRAMQAMVGPLEAHPPRPRPLAPQARRASCSPRCVGSRCRGAAELGALNRP